MPKKKTVRSAPRSSSTSAETFEWVDAPPTRTRKGTFDFPAEKLKAKKSTWAMIKETPGPAGSPASYIKKRLKALGETGFEVISRGNQVFARYTGK